MDCNTFWIIFGTSKMLTNYRPVDPALTTTIFQTVQENDWNIFEKSFFHIETSLNVPENTKRGLHRTPLF